MKNRNFLKTAVLLLVVLTISCQPTQKADNILSSFLVEGFPEEAGMSTDRINKIDGLVQEYIDNGLIPGAVGLVARDGKIVYHKAFGMRDIEDNDPMEKDDIFRIASMSKAITSVAVMMLYEDGKFLLNDPISKYIPEFKDPEILVKSNPDGTYESKPAEHEITVRHLLTHTSGIGYGLFHSELKPIYDKAGVPDGLVLTDAVLGDKIRILAGLPLLHEPGEKYTYGLNMDVLGYFVEVLSGISFDEFLKERIFKPIGMDDTYFFLPEKDIPRLATIYAENEDGISRSDVEEYQYPVKGAKSFFAGGAGLNSTALDYAKFLQMLVNGGSYRGHQLLSPKTVELISMNQVGDLFGNNHFGLGFGITTDKTVHENLSSVGNYWWGGYFHTHFWIDPKEDMVAVLMLQMYPVIHGEITPKFQNLVYQAITEMK